MKQPLVEQNCHVLRNVIIGKNHYASLVFIFEYEYPVFVFGTFAIMRIGKTLFYYGIHYGIETSLSRYI